jgi:hypothetical protein
MLTLAYFLLLCGIYAECHNFQCLFALSHYAECCFAECHFGECPNAECHDSLEGLTVYHQ